MQQTPWENLVSLSQQHLLARHPFKHNMLLGGVFKRECEILALDLLIIHGIDNAMSFHRMPAEQQESAIGGIETLMFDDIPPEMYKFYEEKLEEKEQTLNT